MTTKYMFVVAYESASLADLCATRDALPSNKGVFSFPIGDAQGDDLANHGRIVKLMACMNATPRKKAAQSIFNFPEITS